MLDTNFYITTNFCIALLLYAELKHSDCMLQVTRLVLVNRSAFQRLALETALSFSPEK